MYKICYKLFICRLHLLLIHLDDSSRSPERSDAHSRQKSTSKFNETSMINETISMIGKRDIRHRNAFLRATPGGKDDAFLARKDNGSRKSILRVIECHPESSSAGQLDTKVLGEE